MRGLIRILFNAVTVLSLLLCLATAVLWLRSRDGSDRADLVSGQYGYSVKSERGELTVKRVWYRSPRDAGPLKVHSLRSGFEILVSDIRSVTEDDQLYAVEPAVPTATSLRWLPGFTTGVREGAFDGIVPDLPASSILEPDFRCRYAVVPHWALAAFTSVLPVGRAWRRLRRIRIARQRRSAGRCPVCDYDLRATPDRCPECGATSNVGHTTSPRHTPSNLPIR